MATQFSRFRTACMMIALTWIGMAGSAALAREDTEDGLMIPLSQRASWQGDLDELLEHRQLRVLVPISRLNAYFDGPRLRGMAVDVLNEFELYLNETLKTGSLRIPVVIIPLHLDQVMPALLAGYGDIIVGTYSTTEYRTGFVDFTNPTSRAFPELVVTSPELGPLTSLDQLASAPVYVRKSSAYYSSLQRLNRQRESEGKQPIPVIEADEHLETADILEMVNANVVSATVVDGYLADLWSQVLTDMHVLPELAVTEERQIGWAIRKNSPQLMALLNGFVKEIRQGTLTGNVIINRYLKGDRWIKSVTSPRDLERFQQVAELFQRYAEEYDFDWLMIAAQAYQESGMDQSKRNPSGAVGIMQIKPATAADMGISDIERVESNIHAGIKYLRWIVRHFFDDPAMDSANKTLLAFASYNAGPSRIARLRKQAEEAGLDPDVWFQNVEIMAARDIGRETVQYVGNIYKYYVAYRLAGVSAQRRENAGAPF